MDWEQVWKSRLPIGSDACQSKLNQSQLASHDSQPITAEVGGASPHGDAAAPFRLPAWPGRCPEARRYRSGTGAVPGLRTRSRCRH